MSVFVITLQPKPGTDGIRSLRWLLKIALRRFGLRCLDVSPVNDSRQGGASPLIGPKLFRGVPPPRTHRREQNVFAGDFQEPDRYTCNGNRLQAVLRPTPTLYPCRRHM